MVLKELVMLAKAPGYLVASSFVANPIDDPDKQYRVIGIIFGHLNLAVRRRERASNCLHQLFCVPHSRSLRSNELGLHVNKKVWLAVRSGRGRLHEH
jgi:hypothetical protein